MSALFTFTAQLQYLERLANSRNGNPRYVIRYSPLMAGGNWGTTMVARTAADHAFVYDIGNPGLRDGDTVRLTIGGHGTIVDMVPA